MTLARPLIVAALNFAAGAPTPATSAAANHTAARSHQPSAPLVASEAENLSTRSDFPFVDALHELDTEKEKLQHLRNWQVTMWRDNGLSTRLDGVRYETLLDLFVFPHVDDEGVLDLEALELDIFVGFPQLLTAVAMDDDGNLTHLDRYISPPYAMFLFTLHSLVPGFFRFITIAP